MIKTLQWLNANAHRAYPLTEDSPKRFRAAGSGQEVELPTSALLDFGATAYLPLSDAVRLGGFRVSARGTVAFLFSFAVSGGVAYPEIEIPAAALWPYRAVVATGWSTFAAVFGAGVATLAALPPDTYEPVLPVILEPALTLPQSAHRLESLLGDAPGSVPISGDVWWEEGNNVRVAVRPANGSLLLVPSPGAGAGFPCIRAEPDRPACRGLLLSVNGVPADAAGNFQLVGGAGVEVTPLPDKHELRLRIMIDPAQIDCEAAS